MTPERLKVIREMFEGPKRVGWARDERVEAGLELLAYCDELAEALVRTEGELEDEIQGEDR